MFALLFTFFNQFINLLTAGIFMISLFRMFFAVCVVALGGVGFAFANSGGVTGQTVAGCTCHNANPSNSVSISVASASGSFAVEPGGVLNLTAVVAHATNNRFGVNIAVRATAAGGSAQGTLAVGSGESGLRVLLRELTHRQPKGGVNNKTEFSFAWTAPATPGTYFLHIASMGVNGNGREDAGDFWDKITPIAITVGSTGVEEPASPVSLVSAFPNPSGGGVSVKFTLDAPAECEITVADMRGNPVFILPKHSRYAGENTLEWNGFDASGNPIAAGRYVAVIRAGGGISHIPLTIAR